jgi:hypothetical protein
MQQFYKFITWRLMAEHVSGVSTPLNRGLQLH